MEKMFGVKLRLFTYWSEGGFSADEVKDANIDQIKKISLGERTLRAETAPIVAISLIHRISGDFRRNRFSII